MLQALDIILEIQELDMKMIRLIRLKKQRSDELNHIEALRGDLRIQQGEKEEGIVKLETEIMMLEEAVASIKEELKKLESKQGSIKKVEEFNALTKEMSSKERERINTEQKNSDLIDKKNLEEEILEKIKSSLEASAESSKAIELEIQETIKKLNKEGREIKAKRDVIAKKADPEILKIYMRLLNNKKDRVVVALENRVCSGCHIALTAQHENLVRKGERLVFCEHCSRILYWQAGEEVTATKKRRRRKKSF